MPIFVRSMVLASAQAWGSLSFCALRDRAEWASWANGGGCRREEEKKERGERTNGTFIRVLKRIQTLQHTPTSNKLLVIGSYRFK
jgi:hypothetical protein